MCTFLLALVLLSPSVIPVNVNVWLPQSTSPDGFCQIRKIYIPLFDNLDISTYSSDISESFRRRLAKRLSKKFIIVGRPDEADAILTGEFSQHSDGNDGYVTFRHAELKTANGEILWHGDFDLKFGISLWGLGSGHVEKAARHIAKDILKTCK